MEKEGRSSTNIGAFKAVSLFHAGMHACMQTGSMPGLKPGIPGPLLFVDESNESGFEGRKIWHIGWTDPEKKQWQGRISEKSWKQTWFSLPWYD